MKAVVTVTGKDKVGIIAMASAECAKYSANIIDISQTVMKEYFAMIMLVELDGLTVDFSTFTDELKKRGEAHTKLEALSGDTTSSYPHQIRGKVCQAPYFLS